MKRAFCFGLVLFLSCVLSVNSQGSPEALETKARAFAAQAEKADLGYLSKTDLETILDLLRKLAESGAGSGHRTLEQSGARVLLLSFGDERTLAQSLQTYRDYSSRQAWQELPEDFKQSKQVRLISPLAGYFKDSGDARRLYGMEFGLAAPPRSIQAGLIVLRIMEEAPGFSTDLKTWSRAAAASRSKDPFAFREMMRHWWEENHEALERGTYGTVKSGAAVSTKASPVKPVSVPQPPWPPSQDGRLVCEFKGREKQQDGSYLFYVFVKKPYKSGQTVTLTLQDRINSWTLVAYNEIIVQPRLKSTVTSVAVDASELVLIKDGTNEERKLLLKRPVRLE